MPKIVAGLELLERGARVGERAHGVDDGPDAGVVAEARQASELVERAHRRTDDAELEEEDRGAGPRADSRRRSRPTTTSVPPGRNDLSECSQVAAPTVSITASTAIGQTRARLERGVRAELDARVRASPRVRLVTHTR